MIGISIIMPVYNSEEYVSQAIESILSQTYENFELILIDDGSKDNSGKICDQFARKDERVLVIHQENAGISAARNRGLQIARGEYITFADNDDEFSYNLLEDNYLLAKKNDADIVKYGVTYYTISEKSKVKVLLREGEFQTLTKKEIRESYLKLKKDNLLVYVWDCLIKKSLIHDNEIYFNESIKYGGEDINFNILLLPHIKKMVVNPKEYYIHFKRYSHSTVVNFNRNKLDSFVINAEIEYKLLQKMKVSGIVWAECLSLYIAQILYALLKINSITLRDKIHFLRELSLYESYNTKYNRKNLLEVWRNNRKRGMILYLFQNKLYYLLYFGMYHVKRNIN